VNIVFGCEERFPVVAKALTSESTWSSCNCDVGVPTSWPCRCDLCCNQLVCALDLLGCVFPVSV
jgi:hypothetical protein